MLSPDPIYQAVIRQIANEIWQRPERIRRARFDVALKR